MPCLIDLILYITETKEIPTNDYFVLNAVGIFSKSSIREKLVVHIVAFYPKNSDVKTNLQRIQSNQFVRASGKFIYDVTNVDGVNTRFLKVLSI
jgi:hypothetical protein